MPIDILLGGDRARRSLDDGTDFTKFYNIVEDGKKEFVENRQASLIYI